MKHRTGYLFQRGKQKQYYLQYRIEGKTIVQSLGTDDKDKADDKRAEIMRAFTTAARADALAVIKDKLSDAKTEAQTAKDEANPPLDIAGAWRAYEAASNRPDSSERTLEGYARAWRLFAGWINDKHPGKLLMRDVDASTAAAYAQHLTAEKVSASTFNQYIGLLRLVWRCLADKIRSTGNPWLNISKKRAQRLQHRHKAITAEQFDNLLQAAPDADIHDLLFVLGWTGQRLVDGVMLRWDAIDFKRRVITLHPVKTARTGKAVHIPLLPPLAELLRKRRDMVTGAQVFPELVPDYERDRSAISKRIQKTFESAGLTPRENLPGIKRAVAFYGAHSLRHFFATQALTAGIPGEIVKRITGHTSDDMLEGYQHIDAAMIGGLADRISNGHTPTAPAALPAPAMIPATQIKELADRLNGMNWKSIKAEMLALV